MTSTIDGLRQQLQQLQSRHERGELDADALAAARAPLERELVALVVAGDAPAGATVPATPSVTKAPEAPEATTAERPPRRLQAAIAGGVLVLAVIGYALTGTPGAAGLGSPPHPAAGLAEAASAGGQQVTAEQIVEMVDKLAQRLKEKPDDAVGWTMLARSYTAMNRFSDAVPAYQKALALAGEDANLLADYADALAATQNGKLAGEPAALIQRALARDPRHVKALALAGSAAFEVQDYAAAVRHWEQVAAALPPDSDFLQQVRGSIDEARQLGGLPPSNTPALATAPTAPSTAAVAQAPGSAAARPATPATAQAGALSGRVSLAPAIAAQASPEDTVFVLARAAQGPRMPLAVVRKQVKDLPFSFTLDDSMAMAPTAKISDHAQVVVIARVSKSGNATPQPGDLSGQSTPVAPGTTGLAVEIRDVVGP